VSFVDSSFRPGNEIERLVYELYGLTEKKAIADSAGCMLCFALGKGAANDHGRSRGMSYKVSIVIEKDEHGYYAYCPELDGCQSQGDSLDEIVHNIREAVALYVETLSEEERKDLLSKEILTTSVEVTVA